MKITLKCVAAAMTMLTAATAGAQTVTGTAMGCFSATAGGCTPVAGSASFGTLTYYGSSFSDAVNSFNIVNFGGNATTSAATNFNNFGSFALGNTPFTFGNPSAPTEFFTLALTFTSPEAGSVQFDGAVTGQVLANHGGGASVDFANNGWVSVGGTSLTARVNDVDINAGQLISESGAVTATITATATPEPASLVLVGTGLLGMIGILRRRLNTPA